MSKLTDKIKEALNEYEGALIKFFVDGEATADETNKAKSDFISALEKLLGGDDE